VAIGKNINIYNIQRQKTITGSKEIALKCRQGLR